MTGSAATSHDEDPFWFSSGGEQLFGIVTRPTVDPLGVGLVICPGGQSLTIGKNRIHVRLARQLAGLGFHTVRFDYAGLGESTGGARPFRLDQPFSADVLAAATWLVGQGVPEVVLLGSCFGARTALNAAVDHRAVRGVALHSPPVRDFELGERVVSLPTREVARRVFRRSTLDGLRNPNGRHRYLQIAQRRLRRRLRGRSSPAFEWVSKSFVVPLTALIGRGIPVLIVYGVDDDYLADFERGGGPIPEFVARAGDRLTIDIVPGRSHGLASVAVQDAVIESLQRWLVDVIAPRQLEPL